MGGQSITIEEHKTDVLEDKRTIRPYDPDPPTPNFLRFLKTGKYRTLVERVLKIVWQALTDFILFLLPLIDFRALRIRVNQISKFISETLRGSGRVREEQRQISRIAVPKDTTQGPMSDMHLTTRIISHPRPSDLSLAPLQPSPNSS
ncbi:hypothetical protein H4Q26_009581 [Puccinia striiformis f. sp. tritici PST-130]|nr:hypothetical protein H4Q26_009581 [Puccinia striiformis f. sp. tritici PST-130]